MTPINLHKSCSCVMKRKTECHIGNFNPTFSRFGTSRSGIHSEVRPTNEFPSTGLLVPRYIRRDRREHRWMVIALPSRWTKGKRMQSIIPVSKRIISGHCRNWLTPTCCISHIVESHATLWNKYYIPLNRIHITFKSSTVKQEIVKKICTLLCI